MSLFIKNPDVTIMSKSVSLLLSAALTFGSVLSTSAAPLAKKAVGAKSPRSEVAAKVQARPDNGKEMRMQLPQSKQIKKLDGLKSVESQIKATNRRALKSATAASNRQLAANINLRGHVVYSDAWAQENPLYGIYTFPRSAEGAFDMVAPLEKGYVYGAVDDGNGHFYAVDYFEFWDMGFCTIDTYDTETWTKIDTNSNPQLQVMATDTGLDPVSGEIYGCFYHPLEEGGADFYWGKADYPNGTSVLIKKLDDPLIACGADKTGQYYGIGRSDVLYKIDKATGEVEELAPVESRYQYAVGGCVNDANNTFLLTWSTDEGGGLLEIDLETGETTELFSFAGGEEVVALYIAKPAADDKAPAAPGLAVACDNGSMDVAITLEMPSTLFDGTPCAGAQMSYSVLANGVEVLSGQAAAGQTVTETVTLAESGVTNFEAVVSNATGSSPKTKTSCYVGKGTPAAPANVTLAWANGTATLTWDPVTTSSDGGFINPADVTYTVLDADGNVLATQAETTFSASVPRPDHYLLLCYKVSANYDGKSSAPTASNEIPLGEMAPPLEMDMTNQDNFNQHTVFDANDDSKKWVYMSGNTYYGYDLSNPADDWLFSPAITFKASKTYKLTASVAAQLASYPERIEIALGSSAAPEAMTDIIVAPTTVSTTNSDGGVTLEGYISVPADGKAYVGFHAISDANMYKLILNSYKIDEIDGSSLFESVTDVSVVPDPDFALKTSISFKAPAKALDGSAIQGEFKVKVLRDAALVAEVSTTAGSVVNLEDTEIPKTGTYTYQFIPVSAQGVEGKSAAVSVFVGAPTPSDIDTASVSLVETTPGTFVLSWDAVTTDVDGNPLDPSRVSYRVYSILQTQQGLALGDVIDTVTGTTCTYVTDPVVPQDLFYLGVCPFNVDVPADQVALGVTVTGTPYEMPVRYSSAEDIANQFVSVSRSNSASVSLFDDSSVEGIASQDGDNCYLGISAQYLEQFGRFTFGKVNVSGSNPILTFYVFPMAEDDTNETVVSVICDGQTAQLATIVHNDGTEPGAWNKIKLPLDQFAGKTIQVALTGTIKAYGGVLYDNIRIANDVEYDLSASIAAPQKVETGKEFDVKVTVTNEGSEDTDSYTVKLLRDGQEVASKVFNYGLAADEKEVATFKQTIGLHDGESATFKAEVVYEADQMPGNNATREVTVSRSVSTLPGVTGLAGQKTEAGNLLTWDPIVIDDATPMTLTEDFESGEPFALEFGDWTFVDGDGVAMGGFQGKELPGLIANESLLSFFVFDASGDDFNDSFAAHSGDKYLAAMFRKDDGKSDEWAISPVLTGDAQTISFYAKSYSAEYKEEIEVWYSTGGTDVESFVKVDEFGTQEVPGAWTLYTADLPAGAKHFAIHSCATGAFMLMLDDVTFTSLGGFDGQLLGYNVYCDGVKLNDAPVAEATYTHLPADDAAHTYHVTAVFDKGESELSEPVTVEQSGIGSILAAGLKVAVEGRSIVVSGAGEGLVTINAVDGKTIHSAKGDARVAVGPAVYLVTVDGKTVKVIVR